MLVGSSIDLKAYSKLEDAAISLKNRVIEQILEEDNLSKIQNDMDFKALMGKTSINMPKITCMEDALRYAGIEVTDFEIPDRQISMAEQILNYEKKLK